MSQYLILFLLVGFSSLGMAFMPAISKKTGVSYSLIYVAIGVLLYAFFPNLLPEALPQDNEKLTLYLTEFIVIISLMGTGIKIDRSFSFRNWSVPLKLISIAMILCIGAAFLMGYTLLQLALPGALLLGAVLAPTDPVLASDVQVGPPNGEFKSETKFSLTSEAGLNDGMAFPFTWLAITLCLMAAGKEASIVNWLTYHLIYKIIAGVAIGYVSGKGVGYLLFQLSEKYPLLKPKDGFLAISLTLCVYALTEMAHGYGFIAVFVSALTLRHAEKGHNFHNELHSFTDQIERVLLGVLLIFFGGALVGGILKPLNFEMVGFALLFLLVVRPLAAYISLMGFKIHIKEKLAISFFGIRGMGSIFYLAFAFDTTTFSNENELWAIVAFTVLISIVMHGLTANPIMKHLQVKMPKEKVPE